MSYLYNLIDTFNDIKNTIPKLTGVRDNDTIKNINNVIEIIVLILVIVTINQLSHRNMMNSNTPEGITYITFVCFIVLLSLSLLFRFFVKSDYSNLFDPLSWAMYPIAFVFSFVIWILKKVGDLIYNLFYYGKETLFLITNTFLKMLQDPTESGALLKYGGLYAAIFTAIIILYYASFDPKALTTNAFTYAISIIVPLIFVLTVVIPYSSAQGGSNKLLIVGLVMGFFTAVLYFYANMSKGSFQTMNYAIGVLTVLTVLVGLSIFFYIFSNYLKSLSGWIGFIVYFIFYIPCLLIDFTKYILKEFELTTNAVYVLFSIELILIVIYLYIPTVVGYLTTSNGLVLLKEGAFLNIQQVIGNSQMSILPPQDTGLDIRSQQKYRQNYAFSMWVFLNPQTPSYSGYNKETQIFNYGDGKPKITYYNNIGNADEKDKYIFYFTDSTSGPSSYEITVPNQKWNNFVFNFSASKADLFINGVLERTFNFSGNIPGYEPTDFITIGSENGLDGAICNVVYYKDSLTLSQITNNYNLLSTRNPPIN
jgi:hypothetical protein